MNHDPFAALNSEQTIIKPKLGRDTVAQKPLARTTESRELDEIKQRLSSSPPTHRHATLSDFASPFLRIAFLLSQTSLKREQLSILQSIFIQALDQLERTLNQAGVDNEQRLATRYLLSTYLDESVANTPWGNNSAWSEYSLLLHYFRETWGGEKVFALLSRFQEQPEKYYEPLRLFHLVLSLGFKGKYHVMQSGDQKHSQLRTELCQTLNRIKQAPKKIAVGWQTQVTPNNKVLSQLPVWLIPTVCLGLCLVFFTSLYFQLNNRSDAVFEQIASLRVTAPDLIRPEPTPAQKTLGEFLNERLSGEIENHNLAIDYQNGYWVITLVGDGLFESGSDQISDQYKPTLETVSQTLQATSGEIRVVGHTDSTPIRSLKYPSNWHLSSARADEVSRYLAKHVEGSRLNSEGAGASEPIASNKTAQDRAMNRRVELWLSDPTQSAIL